MIKTKFVFAVSLVAMLAVGSAWAYDPADTSSTTDTVATEHKVYTDQTPTTGAGIAGVSYVNKAVNKAGASATAAEAHAAAAGASALAAADSAAAAASSAQSANDALVNKQPKSTADYQMGNKSGGWTTMTTKQKNALDSGVTSTTKVTRPANTAVGSATVPVYVDADGTVKQITSYDGNAASATKATQDGNGKVIADTYATKAQFDSLGNTQSGLVSDVNELKTGKQDVLTAGANITIAEDGTISAKDTVYTLPAATSSVLGGVKVDTALSSTSTNPVQNKVINTALGTKQNASTAVILTLWLRTSSLMFPEHRCQRDFVPRYARLCKGHISLFPIWTLFTRGLKRLTKFLPALKTASLRLPPTIVRH